MIDFSIAVFGSFFSCARFLEDPAPGEEEKEVEAQRMSGGGGTWGGGITRERAGTLLQHPMESQ